MSYTLGDFQHLLEGLQYDLNYKSGLGTAKIVEVVKACSYNDYVWHGRFVVKLSDGRWAYLCGGICESDYFDYTNILFGSSLEDLHLPLCWEHVQQENVKAGRSDGVSGEGNIDKTGPIDWDEKPADLNRWLKQESAIK